MDDQNQTGTFYPRQDVTFATTKSAAIGGMMSGGMMLALGAVHNAVDKKPLTHGFGGCWLPLAALTTLGMGVYAAAKANISTRAINNRREAMNKFASQPEVQDAIRTEVGSVDTFEQKSGKVENLTFATSIVSLATALISQKMLKNPALTSIAYKVFGGSMVAGLAAHTIHSFRAPGLEKQRLSFVDKINAERGAQPSYVTR